MLLSTSNFRGNGWGKSWLLALLLAALLLGSLELLWRVNGHRPAIVDDQRLWSMERSRIGNAQKEIVLLGSSRMETDISTSTLRKLAPEYNIRNLSIDGTCGNAVLRDLADNSSFRGIVIWETTSECLLFGDEGGLSQQSYIDFYHKVYNLNIEVNRIIATLVQKHLAIVDPYLNLTKVAADFLGKKEWRAPNYVTVHEDRTRAADYSKLDIAKHRAKRLQIIDVNYANLAPYISVQTLEKNVLKLDTLVTKIQHRGGKVVFLRFPVSAEHWLVDQHYFPREIYWDNLPAITQAQVWHFQDIEGMNNLECPDTSHLDTRDTVVFTVWLLNELVRRKVIEPA